MIQVQERNVCTPEWHDNFKTTPIWTQIEKNYEYIHAVISTYQEVTFLKAALNDTVYEYPRRFLDMFNIIDSTPYYYINYLLEINPKKIVDIGCGDNVFKKTFPDLIVGVDNSVENTNGQADIYEEFNVAYVEKYRNSYEAVMSMNTIHFSPINTITERLLMINELLVPGGRAFVSFNIETWIEGTRRKYMEEQFGIIPKLEDVINYVNDQILATGLNFLVVDWPILHITKHSTIRDEYNGNIRLVFERNKNE